MIRTHLGIDCGGTNIKIALVKDSGDILASAIEPINFKQKEEKVVAHMAARIRRFLKKAKVKGTIPQVGMGIAGDVDQEKGLVRFSPNLGWRNVPVGPMLSEALATRVRIENDANCAAWGAWCLDAGRACDNLICLTLGTGVGGGIVVNRKLYRGVTGSAGEIGHMTIQYQGRPCRCGNYGCIESLIGAWGLIKTAEEGLARGKAPILKKLISGKGKLKLEPKTIAQAAQKGDAFCLQLWKEAGEQLGSALSNLVNIFNPDRIVLSGGVSKVGAMLLDPALHTLGSRAFKTAAAKVQVSVSRFDERLGVVGAALLFSE